MNKHDINRHILCAVAPALVFFGTLLFAFPPAPAPIQFDPGTLPPEHAAARVRVVSSMCRLDNEPALDGYRHYECGVSTMADRDWEVAIELRYPASMRALHPRLVVIDNISVSRFPYAWIAGGYFEMYRHVACREIDAPPASDVVLRCTLHARPWRTYTLLATWSRGPDLDEGGIAAEPVRMLVIGKVLGLRASAIRDALWQAAVALAGVVLIYLFRPGGPRSPRWLSGSRFWAVALTTGAGALLSAWLVIVLPPDLGGYDELDRKRFLNLPVWSVYGAGLGLLFDGGRRVAQTGGLHSRRVLLSLLALAVLLGLAPALFTFTWSAWFTPGRSSHFLHYKNIWRIYWGMALAMPLLLLASPWPRRLPRHEAGALLPTRSRALYLLGAATANGLIASIVAVLTGWLLHVPTSEPKVTGFYKPMSIIGIALIVTPFLASLALVLTVREERPAWVQRVETWIGEYLSAAVGRDRVALARQIRLALLERHAEIPRVARFLGNIAHSYPCLGEPRPADMEQLARTAGMTVAAVENKLARISRALTAALHQHDVVRFAQTPLLLVAGHRVLERGAVQMTIRPDLTLTRSRRCVVVQLAGQLLRPGCSLHEEASAIVHHVLDEEVGDDALGRAAFERTRIVVDFEYDRAALGRFTGSSYQLGLALLTWQLARRATPIHDDWMATGMLSLVHGVVERVDGVDIKVHALLQLRAGILLCPLHGFPASLPDTVVPVRVESTAELPRVRREIRALLARQQRVVVGVRTFRQARLVLFG